MNGCPYFKLLKVATLALGNLIHCKLQSFPKKDYIFIKIIPCISFRIPSVLKAYDRVCRETNQKCNLLSENPMIAFVHTRFSL